MRKQTALLILSAIAALILDSRCAAQSVREAMNLCTRTLIPSLFPLFVLSSMAVPALGGMRCSWLSRLLGLPAGGEGILLLGCAGGFPVGAAAVSQCVREGTLDAQDAERMLGLCSFCGPAFLFGVLPRLIPMERVSVLFVLQLETALLLGAFWPGRSQARLQPNPDTISLPEAVRRAISSMASVCAWVALAAVAAGFLRRWLFPLLPRELGLLLTGLLELTNGVFALPQDADLAFVYCAAFVCFGGVSVLLQIGGLAAPAGLSMGACIAQKTAHAILGAAAALVYLYLGPGSLLLIPALLFAKITVEIPGRMVYNSGRKEGI